MCAALKRITHELEFIRSFPGTSPVMTAPEGVENKVA